MATTHRDALEKEIRENFENSYKERLLTMKKFYEMRNDTLLETIRSSYKKVLQD